ncbi:MAG: glycosyltransferase family 87 protein [Acidobacteriota bacterium]
MIETTRTDIPSPQQTPEPIVARFSAVVPLALLVLGTASAGLYFWGRDLHRFTQWIAAYIGLFVGQLGFYVVACYVVLRWSKRSSPAAKWATIGLVIFFAAGFRAVLVPQRPYLSTDVYRYIWDGHLQAAGINPYRYVPEAPELSSLRDDKIFPNLNREDRQWLSAYPPMAQIVFFAVSCIRPMSVAAFKAAMASFDLITVLLLMLVLARSGLDPARAIIFAWHPLVIFEGSHSGHIESVFVAFLALALLMWSTGKHALTGVSLALATLVKFYPILLLPVFLSAKRDQSPSDAPLGLSRRERLTLSAPFDKRSLTMLGAFAATVVLAYLPYAGAGSNVFGFLRGYIEEEGFIESGSRYFLLAAVRELIPVLTVGFLVVAAIAFAAATLWWALKKKLDACDVARGATTLIGLFLLVTTPRYPWYYVWIIPFLCLAPRIGWLYLTCASTLLYLVWYTPLVYPEIPLWLGACIYVPTLGLLAWEYSNLRWKRGRPARNAI